jgi:hypothetical protein
MQHALLPYSFQSPFLYVCMHICMYVCGCAYMSTRLCFCVCVCVSLYACHTSRVCITCMYVCMYVQDLLKASNPCPVHTYMHTYIYAYIRTHTHACTQTHMHTFMHTYIRTDLAIAVYKYQKSVSVMDYLNWAVVLLCPHAYIHTHTHT